MNEFDTFRFALHTFYVVLIMFGNSLTITVLYYTRQWRTPSGLLVGNLAITDASLGVFVLPFGFRSLLAGHWDSGRTLCVLNGFTNQVLSTVGVLTLAVISADRYVAIIHSLRYHQIVTMPRTFIAIAIVWMFGIFSAVLPLAGWGRYVFAPGTSLCVTDFKTDKAFTYFVFNVVVGIPLNAIFFIYIQIFRAVRRQLKAIRLNAVHPRNENTPENNATKEKRKKFKQESKAALIMFVTVGVFVACLTPFAVFNLYCLHTGTSLDLGDFITSKAAYAHALFNPLIYGVMNKAFRRCYYKLLYTIFRCRKPPIDAEETTNR